MALIAVAKGSEWQVVEKSTIDIKPGAGVVEATLKAVILVSFYSNKIISFRSKIKKLSFIDSLKFLCP